MTLIEASPAQSLAASLLASPSKRLHLVVRKSCQRIYRLIQRKDLALHPANPHRIHVFSALFITSGLPGNYSENGARGLRYTPSDVGEGPKGYGRHI
jgi:hypothetical protein